MIGYMQPPKPLHFRPRGAKPKTEHSISLEAGGALSLWATLAVHPEAPTKPNSV